MRVLMLSWEYPPNHVGGLGKHVCHLSQALAKDGIEVHVVTHGDRDESLGGKNEPFVHRITPYAVSSPDFLTWVLQLNVALLERAVAVEREYGPMDLVHAHDWLVAFGGRALKHALRVPMIATIHATEAGRNNGIHNRTQSYISDVEWWLGYEAWKIICCSSHMKNEVMGVFRVPADKIAVIPNGVNPEEFTSLDRSICRERFASPDERLIFFIGRLVREKGVQTLVEAIRILIDQGHKVKLVVSGTGPYEEDLKFKAAVSGVYSHTYFTGRISDKVRNHLYRWADAAVFPSLYEPFGIVALEAMAAGSGLVVSDTGGMSEVVTHGTNGLKVAPGDAHALASAIARLINDSGLRDHIRREGFRTVSERYTWARIASQTEALYRDVLMDYSQSPWGLTSHRHSRRQDDAGRNHGRRRRFPPETSDVYHSQTDGVGSKQTSNAAHPGTC